MTEYMKVKEYADNRGLSPWTVYRLIEKGEIESERFGRCIRIIVRNTYTPHTSQKWKGN
jgi:excisionase family DNA binding protein